MRGSRVASLFIIARAELYKLLRQPISSFLLVIMLIVLGLNFDSDYDRAQEPAPDQVELLTVLPEEYQRAVTLPGVFDRISHSYHAPVVFILLLVVITVSQDFGWGTMRTVLSREPKRGRLLLARFVALAAVAMLYLLISWLVFAVLGGLASLRLEGETSLSFLDGRFFLGQVANLARTWLLTWPVIAFGLLVAVWAKNAAISIILSGMTYLMAWMALMIFMMVLIPVMVMPAVEAGQDPASVDLGIWGDLVTFFPHHNMTVVAYWGYGEGAAQDPGAVFLAMLKLELARDPWQSLALLSGYSLLSLGLAWWILRRKDVTP